MTEPLPNQRPLCPPCTHLTAGSGDLALIAVGNSLVPADSAALILLEQLSERSGVCKFPVGIYTAVIPEIIARHRVYVIIDAIPEDEDTYPGSLIPLSEAVIENRSPDIPGLRASHGISFMDELRIYARTNRATPPGYFLGIASSKMAASLQELEQALEQILDTIEHRS
ncbi:MAG: hypothetical protein KC777_08630 [Cyanobacteria bacterium HKST-UBA02]|nr:hypothetical protein [Cyanobacteria bacterium HKST-UBA02]